MKVRIDWFQVYKIVSGGQTGADRAALDWALIAVSSMLAFHTLDTLNVIVIVGID